MDESTALDMVLWSDDTVLAVNKPAGLLTIPGGYQPEPHLRDILEPVFGRLWVVHRLDRDTSGVLVLARSAAAHRALNTQFQEHTTAKVYHALVRGSPEWDQHTVDVALRPNGDRRHRTVALRDDKARNSKPALTACRVIERLGEYTLLEAIPKTGRRHQIRAHLAYLGLYIVADELYRERSTHRDGIGSHPQGNWTDTVEHSLIPRTALHALTLTLLHPLTLESMLFEASYPEDFAIALGRLRQQKT
jgi:RluA family pseudouridine synthase